MVEPIVHFTQFKYSIARTRSTIPNAEDETPILLRQCDPV
jgi:hypothetical protein